MAAHSPKQYLHIAGKSMLQHSVNAFLQHRQISHIFVVVSRDDDYVAKELQTDERLTVLFCGGESRAESVKNGLEAMQNQLDSGDWVLVHDAARPGLNPTLISRLIDTVGLNEVGGLLALPVMDTVKQTTANKVSTISREGLWLAQTPQMFKHGQLLAALLKTNSEEITDEASAIEMSGLVPKLVVGHWCNSKITQPDDLTLIETYLKNE
jgi:2-C-methyl-D-erythritol 4-phosphate cytidylyltransferase